MDLASFWDGAGPVAQRYLRQPLYPPFEVAPFRFPELGEWDLSNEGLIEIKARICLDSPDAVIIEQFRKLLTAARRKKGRFALTHRPPASAALKRDLVVFALDRAGWQIVEIEKQLNYMGCIRMPENCKGYLRKTRTRFRAIVRELQKSREAKEARELEIASKMFDDMLEDLIEEGAKSIFPSDSPKVSESEPK